MATSLIVPVAYITVLVAALAIFSRVYRKRRAAEKRAYDPWFPSHPTRDTYITLLSSPTPVPDNLLKSALLCRAQADVKRIWRLRDDKAALANLHQRGLVGDETMARFEAAEKELEAELVDVVQEANTFRQGWGQIVFATATEMAQAERTREVVLSIPKMRAAEDKRLARRARYTKGLETVKPTGPTPSAPAASVASGSSTPNTPAAPAPASAPLNPATSASAFTTPPPATTAPAGTPNAKGTSSGASSASASAGNSRSGSPGPNEALNAAAGGSGGSQAGTPSKSTPGKKKKGRK